MNIFHFIPEKYRARPWAVMLVLMIGQALVMYANMWHDAAAYIQIIPAQSLPAGLSSASLWDRAYLTVAILDLVVLIFTFAGSRIMPIAYALGQGAITLYFFQVEMNGDGKDIVRVVFTLLFCLAGPEFAELAYRTWTGIRRPSLLSYLRIVIQYREAKNLWRTLAELTEDNSRLRAQMAEVEKAAKRMMAEGDARVSQTIAEIVQKNAEYHAQLAEAAREEQKKTEVRLKQAVRDAFLAKGQPSWMKEGGDA